MDLLNLYKTQKPNASDITIKTYISNIKNLHNLIKGDKEINDFNFLEDFENVNNALKSKVNSTIKNYLVSVIIALGSDKKYDKLIDKYNNKIKQLQEEILDQYDKNEKNGKQEILGQQFQIL